MATVAFPVTLWIHLTETSTKQFCMTRKDELIETLALRPHPEGGFFKETYRSGASMTFPTFDGQRSISTGIYFLLGGNDMSHFHRIKSDEMWHHYEGSALTIHLIHEDGMYEALHLGKNVQNGEAFQHVVPAGAWFGATVDDSDGYTLAGCTVAPGFDFSDFEMAERYQMLQAFPEHESIIKKLTTSLK